MSEKCAYCGKNVDESFICHNYENPELTYGVCWDCLSTREEQRLKAVQKQNEGNDFPRH